MAGNPLVASNLTDLGRLGLAHTAESNASRARDSELAAHMVQSVAQNRLAQQQLAQSQQRDNMNTALALAQLQDRNAQTETGFTHAMELQKAHNDAQMDMLSKQLANALEISRVNAGRIDPSLAGGIMGANIEACNTNVSNDAIASQANQEKATLDLEFASKRSKRRDAYYFTKGGYQDALDAEDLAYQKALNDIATRYSGKVAYDPNDPLKPFKPVRHPSIQFPRSPFSAVPGGSPSASPSPFVPVGPSMIPPSVTPSVNPVAPTLPEDKILVQGGIRYQFNGSEWVPIQ